MLKNKKAVIFDLDGTLSNTLGAITEAVNMTMSFFGYPLKSEDSVRRAIGNGAKMLMRRVVPESVSDDENQILKVLEKYNAMYAITCMHTTEMYSGIKETVEALVKRKIKVAIFSNKQDGYVKKLADMYFPNGEITLARGQTELPIKPDPTGVKIIMQELGVTPEDCVFVGDSGVDVATAQNANMDFIGAGWGFCGGEELSKFGAKLIADDPKQILDMLN